LSAQTVTITSKVAFQTRVFQ